MQTTKSVMRGQVYVAGREAWHQQGRTAVLLTYLQHRVEKACVAKVGQSWAHGQDPLPLHKLRQSVKPKHGKGAAGAEVDVNKPRTHTRAHARTHTSIHAARKNQI